MPLYLQGFGFIVLRVGGAAILFFATSLTRPIETIDWKQHGGLIVLKASRLLRPLMGPF